MKKQTKTNKNIQNIKIQSEKSPKNETKNESIWLKPKRKASKNEVKMMFGLALKNLIIVSMKNHVYSFNNEYSLQQNGAATGLDETGELADLVML